MLKWTVTQFFIIIKNIHYWKFLSCHLHFFFDRRTNPMIIITFHLFISNFCCLSCFQKKYFFIINLHRAYLPPLCTRFLKKILRNRKSKYSPVVKIIRAIIGLLMISYDLLIFLYESRKTEEKRKWEKRTSKITLIIKVEKQKSDLCQCV